MMRCLIFALGLAAACASCSPQPRTAERSVIDIDGLIDRQLGELVRRKPTLKKEAGVNTVNTDTLFVPGETEWKAELEVFRTLGAVNHRIYAGTYREDGSLDDPQSNLLIQQYSSAQAPLKRVRVYYQDDPERIRRVDGEVQENTPLYTSHRRLSMWFEDEGGVPLLIRYEIDGYQKTSLRDTARFRIIGMIRW